MEVTKENVSLVRIEANIAYTKYNNLKQIYLAAQKDWEEKKRIFEDLDYQLALIDGRLNVIPPKQRGVKKPAVLSLAQIEHIASVLGISLDLEKDKEDEEDEEVIEED